MTTRFDRIDFVKGVVAWEGLPQEGLPELAMLGRSNVGKSTLINFLLGRRKPVARTSSTPGKTREINYYRIDDRFYLVDMPGLGYARTSRRQRAAWERLIDRYLSEHPALACVLHLIDSRHPPTPIDLDVMDRMSQLPVPYIAVLTKSDKLKRSKQHAALREAVTTLHEMHLDVPVILTSAEAGEGREELWELIAEAGVPLQ